MDASNPLNPQSQPAQPGLSPQTPPAATPAQPNLMVSPEQHPIMTDNAEKKSSNKLVLFLVGGIIIAVLAAGGIYLYLNNQKQATTDTGTSEPAAVATPALQAVTEEEVQSVDVIDVEAEFTDVNKDLQGL